MGTKDYSEEQDFYLDEEESSSDLNDIAEEENTEEYGEDSSEEISEEPALLGREDSIEDEASMAKTYGVKIDDLDLEDSILEDDEEDEDQELYTPEERLRMLSDSIMSCCVGNKSIKGYALDKLTAVTNPRLFRDENYILFSVFFAYRSKLKRINIDEEFLKLFLNRNRNMISRSKAYIDINAYGEVDGSVELGYIGGVIKHFTRLKGMPDMKVVDFETCFEKYLIEFKAIETAKIYSTGTQILTEGITLGRRTYMGFDDSQSYVKRMLAEVEGLVDLNVGSGFVRQSEIILEEKEDGKKPYKVSDFGKIKKLNEIYGGIYTGTFYQFLAPLKSGKTKFISRLCHTASVVYGTPVSVWAAEGGKDAWAAQQRAIHFDYTYNQGVSITDRKYGVDQKVVLEDSFPSDELRELEMSSKIDLASNSDYGSVDYIDRPFNVETFIEDIDTSIKENGSKIIFLDYLQLIQSSSGMNERERIAKAYIDLLAYCKKANVAIITPGQYKQEAINALIAKGDTSDADMRTSGGGSAEVLRTPDVIIAMWASTQDLMNNRMKLLSMPCRMSKAFPEINLNIDLGTCQFISVD